MIKPEFVDQDEIESTVFIRCRGGCGQLKEVKVFTHAYEAWQQGMLIQRAMPELGPDQRELLISGTCGECWDKLFPEPEVGSEENPGEPGEGGGGGREC